MFTERRESMKNSGKLESKYTRKKERVIGLQGNIQYPFEICSQELKDQSAGRISAQWRARNETISGFNQYLI